jgi:hypothetical protein
MEGTLRPKCRMRKRANKVRVPQGSWDCVVIKRKLVPKKEQQQGVSGMRSQ